MSFDDSIPPSNSLGRSFMATSGRTSTTADLLPLESIVAPAGLATSRREQLTFERRSIVEQMSHSLSIAEVSATFGLPMVASQVLVSEMVVEGLLILEASATTEIDVTELLDIRNKIASL